MKCENYSDVVVIGGGLGGLTASIYAARLGRRVTLLERSRLLGGRARTDRKDGFHANLGPHALYRGGPAMRILKELGLPDDSFAIGITVMSGMGRSRDYASRRQGIHIVGVQAIYLCQRTGPDECGRRDRAAEDGYQGGRPVR